MTIESGYCTRFCLTEYIDGRQDSIGRLTTFKTFGKLRETISAKYGVLIFVDERHSILNIFCKNQDALEELSTKFIWQLNNITKIQDYFVKNNLAFYYIDNRDYLDSFDFDAVDFKDIIK